MLFFSAKDLPMKLRPLVAGLILTVAIAPTAMAAPKPAPAPQPVAGSSGTVTPQFICHIWPSLAFCHR